MDTTIRITRTAGTTGVTREKEGKKRELEGGDVMTEPRYGGVRRTCFALRNAYRPEERKRARKHTKVRSAFSVVVLRSAKYPREIPRDFFFFFLLSFVVVNEDQCREGEESEGRAKLSRAR